MHRYFCTVGWPALVTLTFGFFALPGCVTMKARGVNYYGNDRPALLGNKTYIGDSPQFRERVIRSHSAHHSEKVSKWVEYLYTGASTYDAFGREGREVRGSESKRNKIEGNHSGSKGTRSVLNRLQADGIKNVRVWVDAGHFYFFVFGLPWVSYDSAYVDYSMSGEYFVKDEL